MSSKPCWGRASVINRVHIKVIKSEMFSILSFMTFKIKHFYRTYLEMYQLNSNTKVVISGWFCLYPEDVLYLGQICEPDVASVLWFNFSSHCQSEAVLPASPAACYIMSAGDCLVSRGGKLRRNWAQRILKEAKLQCYIRDVFLPLGWDDADDGGPEIGLSEGRRDAAHTIFTSGGVHRLVMHSEGTAVTISL